MKMESENKRQNILEIKDQIYKINQRLEHIKPWTDNLAQPIDDYELEYFNRLNSEKRELINQKKYLNFIVKRLK
jgi:hypothetical protein